MNDQAPMMNQSQMMSQAQMMNPGQPPSVLVQSQAMNQPSLPQVLNPQSMGHGGGMNQQQQQQQQSMMMNQRSYKPWPPQQQSAMDPNKFPLKFNNNANFNFVPSKPRSNKNWKGKTINNNNNNKDHRRMPMEKPNITNPSLAIAGPSVSGGGYKPPSLNDLQTQNRMKARKYYHPKKKFNNRFAPYAPRNTTSFIIRAKKAGGIASLVSPCPVTPAVLPTPMFSPSREVLGDMAKEEWGVDGYGSMKGLIRLRSPGNGDDDDEEENGSSESDVEEHVEVERRLDHDLSRFEMIYPNYGGVGVDYSYNNVLENRVDDQDSHIAQLEEENLTLKERLFLMERELGDLRRRMQFLERQSGGGGGRRHGGNMAVVYVNEEVVENDSENESDGDNDGLMEYVGANLEAKQGSNREIAKGGPENENEISEFDVKDEVTVMEDECRGEEIRNGNLNENVAVKQELVEPDISKDKLAIEKDNPEVGSNIEDGPENENAGSEIGVKDEVIVMEYECRGEEELIKPEFSKEKLAEEKDETNSEKSIGSGN